MMNELLSKQSVMTDFSIKQFQGEEFENLTSFVCPKIELAVCGKKMSDDVVDGAYTIFGANMFYSTGVGIVDNTYLELGNDAGIAYALVTGIHHALSLGAEQIDVVYENFKLLDYFIEGGLPRTTAEYSLLAFIKWLPLYGINIRYIKKKREEYSPLIEMIGEGKEV